MYGKFQLFQGNNKDFYFTLKAPNGERLCHSEGYTTKQGAQRGIDDVKRYAPNAGINSTNHLTLAKFNLFQGYDRKYYFNLQAPNGEKLCQSEGYNTEQSALHGIHAVKQYAPHAPVEDLTLPQSAYAGYR